MFAIIPSNMNSFGPFPLSIQFANFQWSGGGRGGGNLHTEFTNNDEIELKWVYPVPTILNNIYD